MGHEHTEHALTTNLACISKKKIMFIRKNERKVYSYSKANYYENLRIF